MQCWSSRGQSPFWLSSQQPHPTSLSTHWRQRRRNQCGWCSLGLTTFKLPPFLYLQVYLILKRWQRKLLVATCCCSVCISWPCFNYNTMMSSKHGWLLKAYNILNGPCLWLQHLQIASDRPGRWCDSINLCVHTQLEEWSHRWRDDSCLSSDRLEVTLVTTCRSHHA